jgi:DNA-directed RNA polymerase subunit beta'
MLEVNNFNAIRISLASPEQIRSWSHGEVTKPETINYRTLKPERDGLFCERIFGPTKDWECYCGKYKRVRYKGVICDKCGVEVARSKVRRERMGHIQLAAPVSHIWFVKGTPSRLGLLMDVSPRNLERVLYFASYIITEVDQTAVEARLAELKAQLDEKIAAIEEEAKGKISEKRRALESDKGNLKASAESRRAELEEELQNRLRDLVDEATPLGDLLKEFKNQASPEIIKFRDVVIVKADQMINEDRITDFEEMVDKERDKMEHEIRVLQSNTEALAGGETDQLTYVLQQEIEQIEGKKNADIKAITDELEKNIDELEALERLQLKTENQYRELREKFGSAFKAGMGAEAIYSIVKEMDMDKMASELRQEIQVLSGQRKKKATKRLRVVEAFRKSGNRPEWMIFTVLPVIPPDLRPMVQLDGGRFATSDLNDLYRRVINRNNRLQRLKELGAPEIIIRNEKRMLQEAVDALIDNGRRGRVVSGSGKHKLKSLSDMLKGKQGRFRQNLLGKRVDYSGRSVIVVGPDLKLHQCGLPKKMALELFKPFVMRRLVEKGYAHNIKSAKRIVERVKPEVWDVLEEVIKDYLVLLNRAPTLHRLGIQAFEAVLIEGSAIQLHPLVCKAYNADFDGDQMAVHVPLSRKAQEEARERMLSIYNLLRPSNGEPVITPTQDIILGCYYLTIAKPGAAGEGKLFASFEEALLAYETGVIMSPTSEERPLHIEALIRVATPLHLVEAVAERQRRDNKKALDDARRAFEAAKRQEGYDGPPTLDVDEVEIPYPNPNGKIFETTVGRILFVQTLPKKLGEFYIREQNDWVSSGRLGELMSECYRIYGSVGTAIVADKVKRLGFKYSTRGGISIGVEDVQIPSGKYEMLQKADKKVEDIERQYRRGLLTETERYRQTIRVWEQTKDEVSDLVKNHLNPFGSLAMMINSGAKGNIKQVSQMSGIRGLMADPTGKTIELPIRSNFREGLNVLEYFISTHGARKGLADTALRTADSGYLTRRLVDVSQDVIVSMYDCGTEQGIVLRESDASEGGRITEAFSRRVIGRTAQAPVVHPETGEIIVERNQELDEVRSRAIGSSGVKEVYVRSPLACEAQFGVCQLCYGRNLANGKLVEIGEAVGIIAAQSIGEPGTQLTMRTFHTGGVAGSDITSGLPRVEELFEARVPKGQAILSEIDGTVEILQEGEQRKVKIISEDVYTDAYDIPDNYEVLLREGDEIQLGMPLAKSNLKDEEGIIEARMSGRVSMADPNTLIIRYVDREERDYEIPASAELRVVSGDKVKAGDPVTNGPKNPQEVLAISGKEEVQRYLIDEVQRVYRSQGVNTNEKHMEIIVRQMLRKVQIEMQGDSDYLSGELIDRFAFEETNARVIAEGGEPATAQTVLLGVTKAALKTDSFLSAASFQETTRVLTEAAINGSIDRLRGLKENVIIGKLIPAGSGVRHKPKLATRVPLSQLLDIDPDDEEKMNWLFSLNQEVEEQPVASPEERMLAEVGVTSTPNLASLPDLEQALGLVNIDRTPFNAAYSGNGGSDDEDEPQDFDTDTEVNDYDDSDEEIDPEDED